MLTKKTGFDFNLTEVNGDYHLETQAHEDDIKFAAREESLDASQLEQYATNMYTHLAEDISLFNKALEIVQNHSEFANLRVTFELSYDDSTKFEDFVSTRKFHPDLRALPDICDYFEHYKRPVPGLTYDDGGVFIDIDAGAIAHKVMYHVACGNVENLHDTLEAAERDLYECWLGL